MDGLPSNMQTLTQLWNLFALISKRQSLHVWDPHLIRDTKKLDAVQRFSCRIFTKSWDAGCSDMLCILHMFYPYFPREGAWLLKMSHLYETVHGPVDFPDVPLLHKPYSTIHTSSCTLILLQLQTHTVTFYCSFSSHAVVICTSLKYIVSSSNVNMFIEV